MTLCSTQTAAFTDHGIPDGTALIETTYYSLAANNHRIPEPTPEYADHLARAFRQAFIRNATVPLALSQSMPQSKTRLT